MVLNKFYFWRQCDFYLINEWNFKKKMFFFRYGIFYYLIFQEGIIKSEFFGNIKGFIKLGKQGRKGNLDGFI